MQGAAITEKSSVKYAVYRKTLSKRSGSVLLFRCIGFPIIITNGSERLLRSPESLSSFKVIPFSFLLLISALLMASLFGICAATFGNNQSAVVGLFGGGDVVQCCKVISRD